MGCVDESRKWARMTLLVALWTFRLPFVEYTYIILHFYGNTKAPKEQLTLDCAQTLKSHIEKQICPLSNLHKRAFTG